MTRMKNGIRARLIGSRRTSFLTAGLSSALSDWAYRLRRRYERGMTGFGVRPVWLRIGRNESKSVIQIKDNSRIILSTRIKRESFFQNARASFAPSITVAKQFNSRKALILSNQSFKKTQTIGINNSVSHSHNVLIISPEKGLPAGTDKTIIRALAKIRERFFDTKPEKAALVMPDRQATTLKVLERVSQPTNSYVSSFFRSISNGRNVRSLTRLKERIESVKVLPFLQQKIRHLSLVAGRMPFDATHAKQVRKSSDPSIMVFLPAKKESPVSTTLPVDHHEYKDFSSKRETSHGLPMSERIVGEVKSALSKLTEADLGPVAERVMRIMDRRENRDHYRRGGYEHFSF